MHGINLTHQLNEQKKAVDSGHWLLYRFDPRRTEQGLNPLQLDSKEPSIPVMDFISGENRWVSLRKINPERAEMLAKLSQEDANRRWNLYKQMAAMDFSWAKK
jgi:pyruvate-ferredoxin/flavodoxin oxidoreductase